MSFSVNSFEFSAQKDSKLEPVKACLKK
jgi:hypothetical protein